MATHSIGRVYVELDLDPKRYTRAQQTLLKEAQHGATILEKNFKNLGIKSGATFDLMRAQAVKSFEAIKKSSKTTTDDIIRAEKAKAEKLRRINEQQYGHATSMFDKIKKHWMATTAAIVAAWYAMGAAIRRASDVVLAAARYETLGVSMRVVGNNAGYTYQKLTELQGGLEKTGISMGGSRQAIIKMAQAQLDLSKATELARGAQHAAVIGAMDSTEAFNQMVYGIQSANVRVLRTIGINVSFEDSYKKLEKQLDRSKETFTQAEKAGARLGATLEALTRLSGTYEAAMETAGKQLLSLNRHFDNLKVMAGAAFTPALLEAVQAITRGVKDLNEELSGESTQKIHEWGVGFRLTLIDIEMDLMRLAMLLDKIGGTMTTGMVGLFSFGNMIGNENSQRQYAEWMKKNLEYEKRYWQTAIDIVKLEEKQLALRHSLTDEGKAEAKAKLDALEKARLAIIAEEKAREAVNKKIEEANAGLKEYWKTLDKHQKIMDPISLAAFPKYERGIESIIDKYAKWNDAIKENAKQAGYSTTEIDLLYANLGLRMDEEIEDYVKSHEEGNDEIYDLWQHTYEKMTDVLADFFETGKFHFKDFVNFFKRQMAEMAAAWVMGDQAKSGFSFANIFGGTFGGGGGGRTQPGTSGIQQGLQGASSAWSLGQAYGAYTTAGSGWGGLKAGAGSFFGMGGGATGTAGSGIGATLSAIPWTVWAAGIVIAAEYFAKLNVKKGYGLVEGTPQGFRDPYQPTNAFGLDFATDPFGTWATGALGFDEPMAGNYLDAAIARSDWGTALKALPATILEWSSPVLTLLGKWAGIDMGKIFGFSNKKRSYYGETYGFQDYSSDEGWGVSDWSHEWRDKREGKKAFGEAGEGIAETGHDLMNALDSMFKSLLGTFDTTYVDSFTAAMAMLSAEMVPVTEATKGYYNLLEQGITEVPKMSFGYYISAEDEGEFEDDWRKSWARMTKNIIDPIVDIGTDLLSQALDSTVTDSTAWNYFTDDMQDYLKKGLESGLEGLRVDWSTVTDQESFEAALEQMGLAVEDITAIVEHFATVGAIMEHITTTIDMHGYSDSVKGAISNLSSIRAEFLGLAAILVSAGIDLEKYTDLQKAYNMAIQDWIEKAFVGAISYAGTSAGWRAMAPQSISSTDQWIQQYQHIQDLAAAHDGTIASAIELSDALGVLSGMSYDLAAEMQSAIASIHESYTSAIESMYLETLSGQDKYDYYKAQASASYDLMMSATSIKATRAYAADVLQYSQGAYGLMSDEQKQQYFSQYQDFLLNVETASTDRIEDLGDAMDDANDKLIEKLTPLIVNMVTDIQSAAVLISSGGADVAAGGADILDAANTPVVVDVSLASSEVG